MSIMIAIVAIWSIMFFVFHCAMSVKMMIGLLSEKDYDMRTFIMHIGMGFMFFVVALDAVLRIFSPINTGLW